MRMMLSDMYQHQVHYEILFVDHANKRQFSVDKVILRLAFKVVLYLDAAYIAEKLYG